MKTTLLSGIVLLSLSWLAQAQPIPQSYGNSYTLSYPAAHPQQNPAEEAAKVVREGLDKLLSFLKNDENRLQVAAFLDKEIAPYFDFDAMAKWVAGPKYARMNESARKALAAKIESRFLSGLAKYLTRYAGQQVRFFRPRMAGFNRVGITVGILRPGTYPAKLSFRLHSTKSGWKVYDVIANGRSIATYYRMRLNHRRMPVRYGY